MIKMPKIKKGPLGYAMDYRNAMARLSEIARQWCVAFDAGDQEAMGGLFSMFEEVLKDLTEAGTEIAKLNGE
jgi:hypothetical protein